MILYLDEQYSLQAGLWTFKYSAPDKKAKVHSLLCLLYALYPLWLIMRILRLDLSQAFCCKYGFGFFCLGTFYFYDIIEKRWETEKSFKCKRPLKIDFDDEFIFFGDYISNSRREEEIGVYKYAFEEKKLSRIYLYNDIRHVHAVKILSPDKIVVLCGDYEEEAKLTFLSKAGQKEFEIEGKNQLIRAVDCYYNGSSLFYGTDTQIEQNYLCRYSFKNDRIKRLKKLEGPVFNMWKQGQDVIGFTVSCEIGLENIDTISIYNYHLQTGNLIRIHSYKIPLKLNKFLQGLFGIPTFQVHQDKEELIVTNNYYLNIFRNQISINIS